jgi:chromosome partitioning protein
MKTLVLANQKGGVGKSAVATLLVHYLARQCRRVLAIDLDHQGNLGEPLRRSGRCVMADGTADQAMTPMPPELPVGDVVLLGAGPALLTLERQHAQHTPFAQAFRAFLATAAPRFDACVIDTNPNPDIRLIAALASCDFVLSPVQLNQEALDGVSFLLTHPRVGLQRIKAVLNPRLAFLGLLPSMVEATPFQRANFALLAQKYAHLLIRPGRPIEPPRRPTRDHPQAHGDRGGPGVGRGAVGNEEDRGARGLERDRADARPHR